MYLYSTVRVYSCIAHFYWYRAQITWLVLSTVVCLTEIADVMWGVLAILSLTAVALAQQPQQPCGQTPIQPDMGTSPAAAVVLQKRYSRSIILNIRSMYMDFYEGQPFKVEELKRLEKVVGGRPAIPGYALVLKALFGILSLLVFTKIIQHYF